MRAEFDASNQAYRCMEDYAVWLADRRPLVAHDVLLRLSRSALRACGDMGFRLKADPAIMRPRQDEPDGDEPGSELWPLFPQMSWPVLVVRGRVPRCSPVMPPSGSSRRVLTLVSTRCRLPGMA